MHFSLSIIPRAVSFLIALILSISVHEFSHAWVADRLGDPTPGRQGRVTLNPLAHIDWIGTVLIPLSMVINPGMPLLGWGKPVQVQPFLFTRKMSMRAGHALVAAAGPLSNLALAILVS